MAAPSNHPALCQGGNRARSVAARTPSGGGRFGSDCSFKEWRAGAAGRTDLRAEGEPGGPRASWGTGENRGGEGQRDEGARGSSGSAAYSWGAAVEGGPKRAGGWGGSGAFGAGRGGGAAVLLRVCEGK